MKERREELGVKENLEEFDIKAKAREQAKARANELVSVDFEDTHTQASLAVASAACIVPCNPSHRPNLFVLFNFGLMLN